MSKLYLYNYNNYFNRIIKRESTLADYGTPLYTLSNCNFNYNDGVSASHDINFDSQEGDYVIITDDNNNIVSRWYVTENKRLRGGQHNLRLRRDLIADNYNKIIKAPMLINRAMINDPDNPLLFNSEGFSYNQIKQNEILLKDRTNTPWYILYFNQNTTGKSDSFTLDLGNHPYDKSVTSFATSIYNPGTYNFIANHNYLVNFNPRALPGPQQIYRNINIYNANNKTTYSSTTAQSATRFVDFTESVDQVRTVLNNNVFTTANRNSMNSYLATDLHISDLITEENFNTLKNGKTELIVKDTTTSKYYSVTIAITSEQLNTKITSTGTSNLFTYETNLIDSYLHKTGNYGNLALEADYTRFIITITAAELTYGDTINWSLDFSNKAVPSDTPYYILAIPKYNVEISYEDSYGCLQEYNEALVKSIINKYGTGGSELVDVQLLPYFPYEPKMKIIGQSTEYTCILNIDEEINEGNFTASQFALFGTPKTKSCCVIFYIDSSSFTFDITSIRPVIERTSNLALNKKISNEVDLYRLCSPNYNGIFEYSNAKNNGTTKFNIDCTLRPVNPYLHINPDFKSLYGRDFDDSRGLICQGDFSIPLITDAFKQYEYQNKNYLNIFNRQIEHMDFEYQKASEQALFGAITGTITGGIGGAVAGSVVGGIGGAVAGGIGGSIASGIGGAVDYNILKQRQAENKDLTIDMFNYKLGNIKALSYSVNKLTPFTANNKIWPFLEIYTATGVEINILKDKITYNSMKVETIGTLENYIQENKTYISGSLIRLEDFDMPTHELNEIYDELVKGVYI